MNILLTGGASGLGEAITKLLVKNPNNTIYFTYNSSKSNAEKIEADFENAHALKCNFIDPDEVNSLTDKIKQLDLDALVNNAYNSNKRPTHFHKIPPESFLSDFNENIIPTVTITQELIKIFRKKKQGKIITVLTSYLANVPPMGLSTYVANKAYLEKLTKIWATENAKFNISSNSISPSFMQTGMAANVDERIIEQMALNHPLKKLLTVKEVAEAIEFLLSASSHINGVDLIMNAGKSIR